MIRSFFSLLILCGCSLSLQAQELAKEINNHFPPFQNGPWQPATPPPQPKPLYPGLFAHSAPVMESYSSKARAFAGVENGALYLRMENSDDITLLADPQPGWRWDVEAAKWSADGRYFLARQIDDRKVNRAEMKDENGREYLKEYSYVGEPVEVHQYYIVDPQSPSVTLIPHGYDMPYVHAIGWTEGFGYLLRADRLMKKIELLKVVAQTGAFEVVITETSDTYLVGLDLVQHYDGRLDNNRWVTLSGNHILWTSERSGFKELYLYTTEGEFIRQLSDASSKGSVERLISAHEGTAWYLTREVLVGNTDHPYHFRLIKTSLDDDDTKVVVEDPVVLEMIWADDRSRFWVLSGSMEELSIREFNTAGQEVKTFWSDDYSFLKEGGFDPEYVWTKVPDDTLTIGTALLKPRDFDPERTYPVVEYIYGPPFYNVLPWLPFDRIALMLQGLANEGYIVVFTDSRGSDYRGKAFKDYSYGKLGLVEIPDHAWVMEELCKERSYMDAEQVGIMGHSMGGYFSLRAMVMRPDLYRAGYLLAPNVDPVKFRVWAEAFYGCLPADCPEIYTAPGVTNHLDRLQGPVMISHGTNDQHIPIAEAYRLMKAMDEAGYDRYTFELFEGAHHQLFGQMKWYTNMITFFKENLQQSP